jgi:hypothetical protein
MLNKDCKAYFVGSNLQLYDVSIFYRFEILNFVNELGHCGKFGNRGILIPVQGKMKHFVSPIAIVREGSGRYDIFFKANYLASNTTFSRIFSQAFCGQGVKKARKIG